jgi:hypothetical protein
MPVLGRTTLAVSLIAALAPAAARADGGVDDARYLLRGEAGIEYDSNPHRLESIGGVTATPIAGSPLARLVLSGSLFDVVADGQSLTLAATGAAKLFEAADARSENVLIAQSSGAWRLALGERTHLLASTVYYEAFQASSSDPVRDAERRDFRSLAPLLQLGRSLAAGLDLTLAGGWRFLVWKPDRDFDFNGPTAGLQLTWQGPSTANADWELGAGASFEHRLFGGPVLALAPICSPPDLPCPGAAARIDEFVTSHVEVTRTGAALAGLGYALQYNRSNSYGETVTRHFAILRFAFPLPADFTLAARAELLYATYRDALPVSGAGNQFVSIDYESRSSAQLDLSRPFGDHLRLALRYTAYFNELGSSSGTYNRQTALLSLSYTQEN